MKFEFEQFVAFTIKHVEVYTNEPFYVEKVVEFGQCKWIIKKKVVWYWFIIAMGMQKELGFN